MRKQEFIAELRQRLTRVDENTKNEVCADIEGHFAEGMAQGYNEEEICGNLGSPSSIAEQFMEDYAGTGRPEREGWDASGRRGDQGFENVGNSFAQGLESLVEGVGSMFGGFTSTYETDVDESFENVRDINVNLTYGNLSIIPSGEAERTRVTIRGNSMYQKFIVELRDGLLTVTEERPKFRLGLFLPWVKLETVIYVPANFNGELRAKVAYGDMEVRDVSGTYLDIDDKTGEAKLARCRFKEIKAHTATGKASAEALTAEHIDLRSTAGSAEILDSKGELDIRSSAGSVKVYRHDCKLIRAQASAGKCAIIDCSADIEANSSAGTVDIDCERLALGRVRAESSAGTVKIHAAELRDAVLSSSAGTIRAEIGTIRGDVVMNSSAGSIKADFRLIEGNIKAKSSMGSIKIRVPNPANCRIETSTRMGSARCRVDYDSQSPYLLRADSNMGSVVIEEL